MNINSRHCVISRLQLQKHFSLLHMECRASQLDRGDIGFSIHLYEVTCLRTRGVACLLPVQCRKSHARMPSDSGLLSGHLAFHTHWKVMSRQRHPLLALKLLAGASLFSSFILWFFCIQEGKSDFGEQFSWNPAFNWTNRCSEGIT